MTYQQSAESKADHDKYRGELAAQYIENCIEPHELLADPVGITEQADMFAEGEMGSLHAGDCCPVCHPNAKWWE